MKRTKASLNGFSYVRAHTRFSGTVENCKRRHCLTPYMLDAGSRHFFERVLNVRKMQDFVFIQRKHAK